MAELAALRVAIGLLHVPTRLRATRSAPLPPDVSQLLRILAGDRQAQEGAAAIVERSPEVVREASAFFVEQVLLCPGADSYRVLGTKPEASNTELRHNMALLIKWLHPDVPQQGQRSAFVQRVTMAWEDLKTPERRAAYDQKLRGSQPKKSPRDGRGVLARSARRAAEAKLESAGRWGPARPGLLRRAVSFLLGGHKS